MSLLVLPLIKLDDELSPQQIISADVMTLLLSRGKIRCSAENEAQTLQQQSRRKAAALLWQARKKRKQLYWMAEQNIEKKYQMAERNIKKYRQSTIAGCEMQWLETHVCHLVDDVNAERQQITARHQWILNAIAQTVGAWRETQPMETILLERLAKQVESLAQQHTLTLRISPTLAASAEQMLGRRCVVIADASLAPDEGVLAASHITITLSLSRHFNALLVWLRESLRIDEEEYRS